ncbi:DUF4226 domain-containing protein [Nocardia sp. NPDC049190]|uniref:C40 family peptidase n=1 Tax=Nocardia sp. NPDC049190 TaxID=3155650 RepID=UPI0033D5EED1
MAQLAPAAAMMLPMLASSLSGLMGDNGSSGGSGAGMSPESQRALQVLKLLEAVYGNGDANDPEVGQLRSQLGVTGSGSAATAIKARQLFQRNAATAFNNLDNQLCSYITSLKGYNKNDKKAVTQLLREVNIALAELGPQAYTKEGRKQVHATLTAALKKASTIVAGTQSSSADVAGAINRLTNQYLYNIAGKTYPAAGGAIGGRASSIGQRAVQVALAQLGKRYVFSEEGPNVFDCSGLVHYAANKAGVKLPRLTADQYLRSLPRVSAGQIRPGDLIFSTSHFKGGRATHVMMYAGVDRSGKPICIQASSGRGNVNITSLPRSYYAARFA